MEDKTAALIFDTIIALAKWFNFFSSSFFFFWSSLLRSRWLTDYNIKTQMILETWSIWMHKTNSLIENRDIFWEVARYIVSCHSFIERMQRDGDYWIKLVLKKKLSKIQCSNGITRLEAQDQSNNFSRHYLMNINEFPII